MLLKQVLVSIVFFLSIWICVSNLDGVPQAVTKAPGEANHNSCATCHDVKGIYDPSISLEVMKTDSTLIHTYVPGETYIVRVQVKATNNPRAYGFQMACLDSITNSDMGLWSGLGEKVKQQTLFVQGKQRKYIVQSSPKNNGIFTANWKAPATDIGKIKFYFTGLAVNLNGNTNGDNNVYDQLALNSPVTSATEISTYNNLTLFPNPATDFVNVSDHSVSEILVIGMMGYIKFLHVSPDQKVDVSNLPCGTYSFYLKNKNGTNVAFRRFVKN